MMLTLTLTLKGSEHQIVLAFDTIKSADGARADLRNPDRCQGVMDDYGQIIDIRSDDIICMSLADVERHWEYRNAVSVIKLRAEHNFNLKLGADPTLQFLVGSAGPGFRK